MKRHDFLRSLVGGIVSARFAIATPQTYAADVLQDDPKIKLDLDKILARYVEAFAHGNIANVQVLHIPKHVLFRMSVSSSYLKQNYHFKLLMRHANGSENIKKLADTLKREKLASGDKPVDLRWGIIIAFDDDLQPFELFFSASGRDGVVNGAIVQFSKTSLASWAEGAFLRAFQ